MDSELERWYSKFDNISDEHGICMRYNLRFIRHPAYDFTYTL